MHHELVSSLRQHRIIPVVTIESAQAAVPLAQALIAGGIHIIEVTLRSSAAIDAIAAIARNVAGMEVGVGTVLYPEQLDRAADAGASFFVSPGLTEALATHALQRKLALLPGIATPSEAMRASDMGFKALKFFPAESAGGIGMLKNLFSVMPHIHFCPTGGISEQNMHSYLALPNVATVGGSWITPKELLQKGQWQEITSIALRSRGATPP